jgi:hypothetical protein
MKKVYLSVLTVACLGNFSFAQKADQQSYFNQKQFTTILSEETTKPSNQLKAGGDLVWSNDFSTPTDWTIDNAGQGAGFGWNINPTQQSWFFNSVINSTSGGNFGELNNGTSTTPVINMVYTMSTALPIDVNTLSGGPNNYILEFQQYGAKFYEKQEVYISTDNTNWVLAGDNSAIEMLTQTGGDEYANPTTKSINLSGFIPGGTNSLWIRFSWTSSIVPVSTSPNVWIAYGWMVDDVRIIEAYADDIKISQVFSGDIINEYDYYSTPTLQTKPVYVGIAVSNEGGLSQTKSIAVDISMGATSVSLTSTPTITLAPGASDTVWFDTGFTASAIGNYTITATVPTDDLPLNNSASENFTTTNFIYGHNHPLSGAGVLSFSSEGLIGIGNVYQIENNQTLKGVDVNFGAGTTAGIFVNVEIWEMPTGSVQDVANLLIESATYQVPSPVVTATATTIKMPSNVTLEGGKTYFAIVKTSQTATEKLTIKRSPKGDADFSTVCYGPFGAASAVNYFTGWDAAPLVSLNFDPSLSVEENTSSISIGNIFPNPTSGETTINYSIANASTVNVEVVDITGKVVYTLNNGTEAAGGHNLSFNAASFSNGVYYVTISTDEATVTKKFIKK